MPAISLEDLQHQIAQRELELENLRQELQARQTRLGELARRKEELEGELRQVEEEIAALGTAARAPGVRPGPAAPAEQAAASAPASSQGQPSLRALVLAILGETGDPMTTRQLCEEAQRRGYRPSTKDPVASVKARLQEMKSEGLIRRAADQPGYVLAPSANGAGKKGKPSRPGPNGSPKSARKLATTKHAGKKKAVKETPGPRGKQPPLREVLTQVLSKSRKPLSGSELAEQVLATGYHTDSKDFLNVIWVGLGKMPNVERLPGKGYRIKKA
jgi:hypothetical protein